MAKKAKKGNNPAEPATKAKEKRAFDVYDPFIRESVFLLWKNLNTAQFKRLKEAERPGKFEKVFLSIIGEISAKIEKDETAPATDPTSPNFDIDAFRQKILATGDPKTGGFIEVIDCFNGLVIDALNGYEDGGFTDKEKAAFAEITETIQTEAAEAISFIRTFIESDAYKKMKESVLQIRQAIKLSQTKFAESKEILKMDSLQLFSEDLQNLIPFIEMELEEAKNDPQFTGISLGDLLLHLHKKTESGAQEETPFKQIIDRAKRRQREHEEAEEAIEEIEQAAAELPRIISNPTDKLNYPLDKPNSIIWNLLTSADKNGQIKMQIDTSKKGGKQDAIIYYGINFDEIGTGVTITRQLTPFDKRCYIAAAALYNVGNEILSATQVYYMMGNTTPPNKNDLQKVNDSLTKMGAARVYINNEQEIKVSKGYRRFKYDAALLPFERISAYINGQLTESAIHLFREPPLMTFARQRNQITTVSRQLLESPVSKTDANLRIDDYLLERIGHMKSGKGKAPRKILFATLHKQCDIKTTKQKQRAPDKIRRYLDYYKECGWIKGYDMDPDGITILL